MVDPVNLNVPGLPYLLFAVAFFGVVFALMWMLSPLELLVRRHQRLADELGADGEDDWDDEDGYGTAGAGDTTRTIARIPNGDTNPPTIDGLFGTVRRPSSDERSPSVVYECRHCGTTLDAGTEHCPRCETVSVVRYEVD